MKYKALILKYVPCIFYNMPYVFFVSAQHSENLREKFPENHGHNSPLLVFGKKFGNVETVGNQISHNAGTDCRQRRFGKQDNGFNARQLAVHVRHVAFVLKILYRAQAAKYELCIHTPCKVNGKVVVTLHTHSRLVLIVSLDGLNSFGSFRKH